MKGFLVCMFSLLSATSAYADDAVSEQSIKDMISILKEKKGQSDLMTPQLQGTGALLLRDAIYLYNLPIRHDYNQTILGVNCDIFQLVLDVENGFTDILIAEGVDNVGGYVALYPDRIYSSAAMFAYALYSSYDDKGFVLTDSASLPGVHPATVVGTATAFGYCFSTNPDAFTGYCDGLADECYLSSDVNPF